MNTYGPTKEGSAFHYSHEIGLSPMVGVCGETGDVLALRARGGSAAPARAIGSFLDECVTPRFPDGLTLLTGLGQFRGSNGVIVQERSMLLILLYPLQARRESSILIDEIRDAYKRIFLQESVLRSDRCCEQVGF